MSRTINTSIHASPVAEGVRFTVGSAVVFAVRRRSKDIALRIRRERRPLRQAIGRTPFVRGMQRLVLSTLGLLDGISESSELEPQQAVHTTRPERAFARLFQVSPEGLVGFLSGAAIVILLPLLIWLLPMASYRWLLPHLHMSRAGLTVAMSALRILCLWLGLFLCFHLRAINRLCMYRGAINKVLNAYESSHHDMGLEDAVKASRVYHRSDAAFLMVVVTLCIPAFALVRTFTLPVQLLVRILTVFVVAGVVNEPIQALERLKPSHPMARLLTPCLWIERLFVLEPNRQMVEVALCAFNAARENDL